MEIITDILSLHARLKKESCIAFIPTMGNLHAGHLSLAKIARKKASCVVVSIFVNRLQFSEIKDFNKYPRTFESDSKLLINENVNVLFAPHESDLFPLKQEFFVEPPLLANTLEGEFRHNFFRNVATIVLKFFNLIHPQIALFGKKDYQQLKIISAMVQQLNLPIEIIAGETIRTQDGLALSSRNLYLSTDERSEATRLYQVLLEIKIQIESGSKDFQSLQNKAREILNNRGWEVDYIALHQRNTLAPAQANVQDLVVLGAARLGNTRLIDNLEISTKT